MAQLRQGNVHLGRNPRLRNERKWSGVAKSGLEMKRMSVELNGRDAW
nr:MAG TPA: hypothetical protein [Caudoviricetes sp.]